MNEEQELKVVKNGEYNNLVLKTTIGKSGEAIQGLMAGNYIYITKGEFAEGFPVNGKYGTSYSCRVTYKDTEVSFFLNEKDHAKYALAGGVGDKIKVRGIVDKYGGELRLLPRWADDVRLVGRVEGVSQLDSLINNGRPGSASAEWLKHITAILMAGVIILISIIFKLKDKTKK